MTENNPLDNQKKEMKGKKITMLWDLFRYDGPMTGIAEYNGKKVYFHWHDEGGWQELPENLDQLTPNEKATIDDTDKTFHKERTFDLYELSNPEIEFLDLCHEKNEQYRKAKCPCDCQYFRDSEVYKEYHNWCQSLPKINYTNNKRLGTFSCKEIDNMGL